MTAFLLLVGIVAAAAWLVAVASMVKLVGLAPEGTRFSTMHDPGWWQFSKIEGRIGRPAHGPITRYRKANLVFFLGVVAGIVSSFVAPYNNTAASG